MPYFSIISTSLIKLRGYGLAAGNFTLEHYKELLPSIVLVIGIMLFWNAIYKVLPLYNTIGIMVLAYVVLYMPYTVQYVTSAFTQTNDNLLQAGRVFGGATQKIAEQVLSLGGAAVMTGTLEKGSYSESLFQQGKMALLCYPVHLNHVQFARLKGQNDFQQTIPYHSQKFSVKREILF